LCARETADIAQELYVSITLDRAQGKPVIMASAAGGMDIEEVAATQPEKIFRLAFDPISGFCRSAGKGASRNGGQSLLSPGD
jgi:succinyl-CoA synthetase beta subunit